MSNKYRFISVLELLEKYSDENHYIKTPEIITRLKEEYDINADRKTIYNDIGTLSSLGYFIDTNKKGYSLSNNYLSLPEIKIIEDLLNNALAIDNDATDKIINKLRDHTSVYNAELLNKQSFKRKKEKSKTYYYLASLIEIISKKETTIIKFHKKENEIIPYLIHYTNSYFYLYYSYLDSSKIYHVRIDRLENINPTSIKHFKDMRYDECLKIINESVDSFSSGDTIELKLEILNNKEFILENAHTHFDNIITRIEHDKLYISFRVTISNILFSKLSLYQNNIRIISPQKVIDEYEEFLKKCLSNYIH